MRIRLTRKLANVVDGLDLSGHRVGDVFDVSARDARILIAEGWAVADHSAKSGSDPAGVRHHGVAHDRSSRPRKRR